MTTAHENAVSEKISKKNMPIEEKILDGHTVS